MRWPVSGSIQAVGGSAAAQLERRRIVPRTGFLIVVVAFYLESHYADWN
jgi:hypothetical protein